AIHIFELSTGALPILILVRRQDRRILEGIVRVQLGSDVTSRVATLFRGDQYHAIRGPRTIEGRRVRTLQDRHRLDVGGVQIVQWRALVPDAVGIRAV